MNGTIELDTVFLHVTKACNLRCAYCYFSAARPLPDELSRAELALLWPDIVALAPAKIVFTGGEPLQRPDLLDLLADLRQRDPPHQVKRCLNTNGHLLTRQLAAALTGLVDEIRLSLDAMRERNDALRGEGNFNAVLRAIDCCLAANFDPKVLVTVTTETVGDLEELLATLWSRGVRRVKLNAFRPLGRGRGNASWTVGATEMRAAMRRAWSRVFPALPTPPEPLAAACQTTCGVGRFLNLMPNGDVFPCHVLVDGRFRCGNVREESLLSICQKQGLLGRLAALDFEALARDDARLKPLTSAGACMGEVYPRTSDAWRGLLS